jgi:hypothetical protein
MWHRIIGCTESYSQHNSKEQQSCVMIELSIEASRIANHETTHDGIEMTIPL